MAKPKTVKEAMERLSITEVGGLVVSPFQAEKKVSLKHITINWNVSPQFFVIHC